MARVQRIFTGWPPERDEGAGADSGGRVGHHHLILEEELVNGWSEGPS